MQILHSAFSFALRTDVLCMMRNSKYSKWVSPNAPYQRTKKNPCVVMGNTGDIFLLNLGFQKGLRIITVHFF